MRAGLILRLASVLALAAPFADMCRAVAQAGPHDRVPHQAWSFEGPLGRFDLAAVQRGYAVYAQVCSACHGMKSMIYGDLAATGLTMEQVGRIAATQQVPGGVDAQGDPVTRAATPADHFRDPFVNPEAAAAANNGVAPPDQSRLALVYPGGPDRIYAVLTGYREPPAAYRPSHAGAVYNPYASGREIAMPPPLRDGQVVYTDGTPATTAQEARDVTTFLAWVAQPHLEARHRLGMQVVLYLLFLAVLVFLLKRRVWSDVQ